MTTYFNHESDPSFISFCTFSFRPANNLEFSTTYSTGDLVVSGSSTYIAVQANSNQQPPNTTYWGDLAAIAANLGVPTEAVPTLSTEAIYASLPNSAPPTNSAPSTNFLNESANYGNAWKRSTWFGVFGKLITVHGFINLILVGFFLPLQIQTLLGCTMLS